MKPESSQASQLSRLRAGDRAALTAAYETYSELVYRVAFRITNSAADAGDVTQDVFMALPEALENLTEPDRFEYWLVQMTARNAQLRIRANANRLEVSLSRLKGLLARSEPVLSRVDLEKAIARLPDSLRVVFVLKDIEGFSHAEVAETLGIRQGAAEVRLHRARQRLRELLKGSVRP